MKTLFYAEIVLACVAVTPLSACDGGTQAKPAPKRVAPVAEKLEVIHGEAGSTELATYVRAEQAKARARGRDLLVYVGASWCEPCMRFHRAAEEGKLDADFPRLSLLEFDRDRDGELLAAAGYTSKFIPLFAVPGPDGRASGRQIEGSIKGDGAVGQITPRLKALLAGGSPE